MWIVIFFLLGALSPAFAATYHVDKNGLGGSPSDSNNGALNSPFLTIAKGVSALSSGDTLYIRQATYNEGFSAYPNTPQNQLVPSGTSSNPTIISGYNNERPTITGGIFFYLYGGLPTSIQYVYFRNMILNPGGFQLTGGNINFIHLEDAEISTGGTGDCINIGVPFNAGWLQGIEIIRVNAHHCGHLGPPDFHQGHGAYICSPGIVVRDSEFSYGSAYGLQLYDSDAFGCGTNAKIFNNKFHHNGVDFPNGGAAGVTLNYGNDIQFYNNIVYSNAGGGVGTSRTATNTKIYNNTIYNNPNGDGIGLAASSSANDVRNNIVYGHGTDIQDLTSNSFKDHNLVGIDPLFLDPGNANFRLNSASQAHNGGVALSIATTDIEGRDRNANAPWDIGAYEIAEGGPPPPPTGNVFYTDKNGVSGHGCNDNNQGGIDDPFCTIARGLQFLAPGKTLFIRAGVYFETISTRDQVPNGTGWGESERVMVAGYAGETATLRATSNTAPLVIDSHQSSHDIRFIRYENLDIDGNNVGGGVYIAGNCSSPGCENTRKELSDIRLVNMHIHDTRTNCVPFEDTQRTVTIFGFPNRIDVIGSNIHHANCGRYGIYMEGFGHLIEGNLIHDNEGYGIQIQFDGCDILAPNNTACPHDITIRNNMFYNNSLVHNAGDPFNVGSLTIGTWAYNMKVYNNVFHHNVYGPGWSGTASGEFYNNTSYGNVNSGTGQNASAGGFVTFKNNISYGNGGANFEVNGSNIFQNNLQTDPNFFNAAANDFRIVSPSPAINGGQDILPLVGTDILGNSRPAGQNTIGAYQFQPTGGSFTFTLSDPGAKSVVQGSSVSFTVTATLATGSGANVTWSAAGLPPFATISFSNNPCTPTCTTNVIVNTTLSTPVGLSTLLITAAATVGGTPLQQRSIALTVSPPAPAGQTFYTDKDGVGGNGCNDGGANTGGINDPFCSIARGLTMLGPGKTLYIRRGVYNESIQVRDQIPSGTGWGPSQVVKVASYQGETAVLRRNTGNPNGSGSLIGVDSFDSNRNLEYIIFERLELDATTSRNAIGVSGNCNVAGCGRGEKEARYIRFDQVNAHDSEGCSCGYHIPKYIDTPCSVGPPNGDGEGNGAVVSILGYPRGFEFLRSTFRKSWCGYGFYAEGFDHIWDGNTIADNCGYGVQVQFDGCQGGQCPKNLTFRNNTFSNNGHCRGDASGSLTIGNTPDGQIYIYNNVFHHNTYGPGILPFSSAELYNNTSYANTFDGMGHGAGGSGFVIAKNNISYGNGGTNFDFGGPGTYQNNLQTNPNFVDVGSNNFKIVAPSPAIDGGQDILPLVSTDLEGRVRPAGHNTIGAYQFGDVAVSGATIYVAKNGGDDSRTCAQAELEATPFLTINRALLCATVAGKNIVLKAGTYVEKIDTTITPIVGGNGPTYADATTIRTFGNDLVTIKLPSADSVLLFFHNGLNDKYILFKGSAANKLIFDGNNLVGSNGIACYPGVNHIRFEFVEVKQVSTYEAIFNGGCNNLEFVDSSIHHNTTGIGMQGAISDMLVQRTTISNNTGRGLTTENATMTNLTIRESNINNNGTDGIFLGPSTNASIFNNILVDNTGKGIWIASGATGTKIRSNTLYSNTGVGVQCDAGATSVDIRNNIFTSNGTNLLNNCSATPTTNSFTATFVAPPTDLRLADGSDGINTGTNDVSITIDYAGLPRQQDQQDIGAHERTGVVGPPGPDITMLKLAPGQAGMFF